MKIITGTSWKNGEYWGGWFRILGYGLCITNMQPMFSERYGYAPVIRVFGVKIALLSKP